MATFDPSSYQELYVAQTAIPSLLEIALPVTGNNRSWFKENYNQEKLVKLGFPANFQLLQNNVSFSSKRGSTHGIHVKPWEKYISIAAGSVFAAIVDLREGLNFGKVLTFDLNPGIALFVPRGCGTSFQTLEDNTVYSYLVNSYRNPDEHYLSINLSDPDLAIQWPIPLDIAEMSDSDRTHPLLKDIKPLSL
jgi:dTDP-4-dehydrorhamnose 3,5-epimerase-like enzyme